MRFLERVKHFFVPHRDNAYRPHLLRRGSLIFLLALCLGAEGVLMGNLLARQAGIEWLGAVVASDIVSLTNTERVRSSVGLLQEQKQLTAAAKAKAADMAAKGYFAHNSPDGKKPWDFVTGAGYDYQYAGENLAVRFVDSSDVVSAWMASPTHRANMVKPNYTEIGVGIAQGVYQGQPATYVVQYFGRPSAAALAARAGAVLGAAVQASPLDTAGRYIIKIVSEPRGTTAAMLGGVATLLLLALAFAFFHHVQIQSREVLTSGALVAGIALTLLVLNAQYLSPNAGGQSASVATFGSGLEIAEGVMSER